MVQSQSGSDSAVVSDDQRTVHAFIVLVALLQGLALYLAQTGLEQGWWPFRHLSGCVLWYTLVLSVPTVMILSVRRLDDHRFWTQSLGLAVIYAALAAWAARNASGAPGLNSGAVLGPFGFSMALGLFVALPYLQLRLIHGRWRAPYPELFEHAWQNGLTALLVLPFVGLCWAVLLLWGQLFALVKLEFFRELFREDAFIYLATGAMAGLGVLVARTQHRPLQILRQVVFAVFKGLLPLVAFIALLFVLSLPFTGLQPLWETRSAAALLMALALVLVCFANAVFQDGLVQAPYPTALRRLVEAGLLTLPVYALLALYAIALRVHQYGWTIDRVYAALLGVVVAAHAFSYAYGALRRSTHWLQALTTVNLRLSWLVMVLIVLVNTPVLDPYRITVQSQIGRFTDGRTDIDELDLETLRFDAGRRGYQALQQMREHPAFVASPVKLAELERVLQRENRWSGTALTVSVEDLGLEEVQARIVLAPGAQPPDVRWLQALADGDGQAGDCLDDFSDCVLLRPDLDADGTAEHLLCNLEDPNRVRCRLWTLAEGRWRGAGSVNHYVGDDAKAIEALRDGAVGTHPHPWPDLMIGGVRVPVVDECAPAHTRDCVSVP